MPLAGKHRSGCDGEAVTVSVRSDDKALLVEIVRVGPESRLYAENTQALFIRDFRSSEASGGDGRRTAYTLSPFAAQEVRRGPCSASAHI